MGPRGAAALIYDGERRLSPWYRARRARPLRLIACYHAVDPDWRSPLSIPPDEFARQLEWLGRWRRVVSLDVAAGALTRRWRTSGDMAAITFDDGFASLLPHALPVLRRLGMPATVFIVADTLDGTRTTVDWVDTPPSYPLTTLTLDEIGEMREHGVSFESHTYSHRDLRMLGDQELRTELQRSREALSDLLRAPVRYLAYPRGRHDARVREAARRAGYRLAFSLPERREAIGRFSVPRIGIYRGNGARVLRIKAHARYLDVRLGPAFRIARPLVEELSRGRGRR